MFKKTQNSLLPILLALGLGAFSGMFDINGVHILANTVADLFIKFLQLISMPIIFFAITSTLTGMRDLVETRILGLKTLKYTLLTTFIAAATAWVVYMAIGDKLVLVSPAAAQTLDQGYLASLMQKIPNNIFNAFSENNVIGVALIAFMVAFGCLTLPQDRQHEMHRFFDNLFQVFLQIAKIIILTLPLGIWAFMTLFVIDMREDISQIQQLSWFLAAVLSANLIQAFIVLPLLLMYKGISPGFAFRTVRPALLTAFFSKSSTAALPLAIEQITKEGKVSEKTAKFCLPMCSIINMNGCAAFILITVLFVASSAGVEFSLLETILWIFIATIAAVGNASIPMGCYFLASALLTSMGVPLHLMGVILTVYVFIDMVETALNVWSDTVVTRIIDQETNLPQR